MVIKSTTVRGRRIRIQKSVTTKSAVGENLTAYEDLLTVWTIDWHTLTGRELFQAQQIQAEASAEITLRYGPTPILPQYRVLYGLRVFEVVTVTNVDEQNQFLRVLIKEVIPSPATT